MVTYAELQHGSASLLARLTGVSKVTFSKWDHGKLQPTAASLEKLMAASQMSRLEVAAAVQERKVRCDRSKLANKSLRRQLNIANEDFKCSA